MTKLNLKELREKASLPDRGWEFIDIGQNEILTLITALETAVSTLFKITPEPPGCDSSFFAKEALTKIQEMIDV